MLTAYKTLMILIIGFILSGCAGNERRDAGRPGQSAHVLIAYFSWAHNTVIENPASADIDAMSSASLIVPGNTGSLARRIQETIGGDLFPITVAEPYSSDFAECAARAGEELSANARPVLANNVSNIGDYGVVFLGYPVWANTCPMAVFSFIEANDLSGKTVLLFSAFGGGSMENSVIDITGALPNGCTVMESTFGASRADFAAAQDTLKTWLAELNISK